LIVTVSAAPFLEVGSGVRRRFRFGDLRFPLVKLRFKFMQFFRRIFKFELRKISFKRMDCPGKFRAFVLNGQPRAHQLLKTLARK